MNPAATLPMDIRYHGSGLNPRANPVLFDKVRFVLSKKASLFRQWGLRPVASHALYQGARLQAEKCFLARACRARKRIWLDFAAAAAKLYEVLMICGFCPVCGEYRKASQTFAIRRWRNKMESVFLPALPVKKIFSEICCAQRARQISAIPHIWNKVVPNV